MKEIVDSVFNVLRVVLDVTTLVGIVSGVMIYGLAYFFIDRRFSFLTRLTVLGLMQETLTSTKLPITRLRRKMWHRYYDVETKEMREVLLRPVDEKERKAAIWWLSQIKDPKTLEVLKRIGHDDSVPVDTRKVATAARDENEQLGKVTRN